jgi:hypothetical protein
MDALPPLYGRIRAQELAQLTGAHPTTARRWKRAVRVPRWLETLVRVIREGSLAEISAAWDGWRIVGGELVSPEGVATTPGEIRAIPYTRALVAQYQGQQRLALRRANQLDDAVDGAGCDDQHQRRA